MSHALYELKAEARERVGTGSSRELRRNGFIPAAAVAGVAANADFSLPGSGLRGSLRRSASAERVARAARVDMACSLL